MCNSEFGVFSPFISGLKIEVKKGLRCKCVTCLLALQDKEVVSVILRTDGGYGIKFSEVYFQRM